ncbi:MAG TPA: GerMN domain-containing protein [Acidimicrobiales bacterium]|nr:GerMN domain-containing protein [Acidimicrobiales bacterium]
MRRRALVGLALGLGALALAACGVPLSTTAQPLSANNVPFNLIGPNGSPTSTSTPAPSDGTPHGPHGEVYFVTSGSSPVLKGTLRFSQVPITPRIALKLLEEGPTAAELKAGLTTRLPGGTQLQVNLDRRSGIATVQLDAPFINLDGQNLYIPLAQIVFTLMRLFSDIKGVNFTLFGSLYNYTPDGTTSATYVTTQTYISLNPAGP